MTKKMKEAREGGLAARITAQTVTVNLNTKVSISISESGIVGGHIAALGI
jgi:hypothetical protein